MRYLCNCCVMQWISPAKHQQICRQSTSLSIPPLLLGLFCHLRNRSFRVVELDRSDELLVNCDKWQVFIILYSKTVNVIVKQKPHYNRPSKLVGAPLPLSSGQLHPWQGVCQTHHRLFNLCCITCWKYVTISLSFVRSMFSLNASYPGHINTWRWVSLQPIASPGSAHPGHVHNSFVCWETLWKFICIVGVISQFILNRRRASVTFNFDR